MGTRAYLDVYEEDRNVLPLLGFEHSTVQLLVCCEHPKNFYQPRQFRYF